MNRPTISWFILQHREADIFGVVPTSKKFVSNRSPVFCGHHPGLFSYQFVCVPPVMQYKYLFLNNYFYYRDNVVNQVYFGQGNGDMKF